MSGLKGNCCVIRGGEVQIAKAAPPVLINGEYQWPHQWRDLGEVSKAEIKYDLDKKERKSHRYPAGGLSCSFSQIKGATLNMTLDCTNADNIALAILGKKTDVLSAAVLAEQRLVIKPSCDAVAIPLKFMMDIKQPLSVTNVGATVTYVNGVDYFVRNGHLYVPAGSSIADSTAPSFLPTIEVNYTRRNQQQVQGGLVSGNFVALQFAGFEIGSGDVDGYFAGVRYAQVNPTGLDLINDDFDKIDLEFNLLPEPTLAGQATLSPYFYGYFAAAVC
jgi:hypothetical protein